MALPMALQTITAVQVLSLVAICSAVGKSDRVNFYNIKPPVQGKTRWQLNRSLNVQLLMSAEVEILITFQIHNINRIRFPSYCYLSYSFSKLRFILVLQPHHSPIVLSASPVSERGTTTTVTSGLRTSGVQKVGSPPLIFWRKDLQWSPWLGIESSYMFSQSLMFFPFRLSSSDTQFCMSVHHFHSTHGKTKFVTKRCAAQEECHQSGCRHHKETGHTVSPGPDQIRWSSSYTRQEIRLSQ